MSDTAQLGVDLHRHIAEVLQETLVVGTDLHGLETLGDDRLLVSLKDRLATWPTFPAFPENVTLTSLRSCAAQRLISVYRGNSLRCMSACYPTDAV